MHPLTVNAHKHIPACTQDTHTHKQDSQTYTHTHTQALSKERPDLVHAALNSMRTRAAYKGNVYADAVDHYLPPPQQQQTQNQQAQQQQQQDAGGQGSQTAVNVSRTGTVSSGLQSHLST